MRQASLVAFYGAKPRPLRELLRQSQEWVRQSVDKLGIGTEFRAYPLGQIHATVIGLETRTSSSLENQNFHAFRGCTKAMHLPELFSSVVHGEQLPCHVQFGGFENRGYPFQSRGASPYRRSFSLQASTAVLIGWPVRLDSCGSGEFGGETSRRATGAQRYPTVLERLRRSAQTYNVLHRWHREPAAVDNDAYLRLGVFEHEFEEAQRDRLEDEMRRLLSASPPVIVRLAVPDLSVVWYPAADESLPEDRSTALPLTDPRLVDQGFVAQLYE